MKNQVFMSKKNHLKARRLWIAITFYGMTDYKMRRLEKLLADPKTIYLGPDKKNLQAAAKWGRSENYFGKKWYKHYNK